MPISAPYLKLVSRVKHRILAKYLVPWAKILGAYHSSLAYVDFFAGTGGYVDEEGVPLEGSPVVALKLAKLDVAKIPTQRRVLVFAEMDKMTADALREMCKAEEPLPAGVTYYVMEASAQNLVGRITSLFANRGSNMPTFFFIDPFGHPISVPEMRQLLSFKRTELLINLMWYALNMHLSNPAIEQTIDRLFGHEGWRTQPFRTMSGQAREDAFVQYFITEMGGTYAIPFPVNFSPEDRRGTLRSRTKFYLLHFSTHPLAAALMKEVMYSESDAQGELGFTGKAGLKTTPLQMAMTFGDEPTGPDLTALRKDLLVLYPDEERAFQDIIIDTLPWPFAEKHYRADLLAAEREGIVTITRVDSKVRGLKGRDRVKFPPAQR